MLNGGAEYGSTEGWRGYDSRRGELGLQRGVGRSGEYAFRWTGQSSYGIHSDWVALDPEQTYKVSGYFRAETGVFTGLTFCVLMADAQKQAIKHYNVFSVKGSGTELAMPCRAGESILRLVNAAGWKTGKSYVAAFGVKENELTFDVTPPGINAIRQADSQWIVVLNKACGLDFPAGTPVAENRMGGGGIFLPDAINVTIPDEWTELKGSVGPNQWWPGTTYARIAIIGPGLRGGNANTILLMDDFAFSIK